MPHNKETPNLAYTWQEQRIWSETAGKLKSGITRSRTASLWLGIAAAGFAAAAVAIGTESPFLTAITLASAGSAALVPFAQRGTATDKVHAWTRARSASEGLKTLVYEYIANGTEPTDRDREIQLGQDAHDIVSSDSDLERDTRPDREPDIVPMSITVNVHHDERLLDYDSRTHDLVIFAPQQSTLARVGVQAGERQLGAGEAQGAHAFGEQCEVVQNALR